MARVFRKSIFILLLAIFLAVVFTTGEAIVLYDSQIAEAARRKKSGRKKRKEKKEKKIKEKKEGDELEDILGGKKEEGEIPLEDIQIKDDVPLESAVGKKIDEAIAKLFKILSKYQEPGTLRRLAEFYWKKAHQLNLDLMRDHQEKMDQWFTAGQKGDPPPEPDAEIWYKYNKKAVEVCKLVIERYPKFHGMDEVYFFMGYNLNEINRSSDAVEYYKRLVREHPNSGYVPDSWMAIGDYYFSNNNVYDALPAYEEVLRHEASKVFGYAKYKIAWCYFNLGKYKDAIETFKEVVNWSIEQSEEGKSQITLMEESLKDLVMAFAEEGNVDEAEKYFIRIGGKKYFRMMLVRLADIYSNQGKLDDSIVVYKRLISDYPLHRDNADFQLKIVEAYSNKNDKENTTKEILAMVYYAKPPEESEWVKANMERNEETVEEAWSNAEHMLIRTVVEYHKEALKINSQATWDKAQRLYEMYIQYFSRSKTYYDVIFNYSELLYKRMMFKQAGEWYTKVAEMDPKGKHFEEASYSAILSYEKLVHKEINAWISDTKKRSKRKEKHYKLKMTDKEEKAVEKALAEQFSRRELSENTSGFVKACNLYIDNIPHTKHKVDIIYKVAIIYYSHNHFKEAVGRFELIVKDYPKHRLAVYSANLTLDSLNMSKEWRQLHATVKSYLKNRRLVPRTGRTQFRRDLQDLYEKSSFKKVEVTEEEGNWSGAAEEYLAFADEFKRSKVRDRALYNASVHYVTDGQLEKSIEIQKKFLKEHAKSPLAEAITYNLAKNYEALAYFRESAEMYEKYNQKYPNGEHNSDAVYNAGVFYASLGETEKSVKMKRKTIERTKKPAEKDALVFGLAYTYLDAKDDKNAEKQFKLYLKKREKSITWPKYDKKTKELVKRGNIKGDPNPIYVSHIELKNIYASSGRKREVEKERATFLMLADCDTEIPIDAHARDAIAEASFYRNELKFREYVAYKLEVRRRLPRDKWNAIIAERMEKKSKMVIRMQDAYAEVVALKSPKWSVAALYQIGQVYKYYSLALFNSEKPYWLTMDQEMIYDDNIHMRAEPIEHKALLGFEQCLSTAYRTGVYSEYTVKARQELQGYVPEIYIPTNEIRFDPGFESDSMFMARFETPDVPDIAGPTRFSPGVTPEEPAMKEEVEMPMEGTEAPEEASTAGGAG